MKDATRSVWRMWILFAAGVAGGVLVSMLVLLRFSAPAPVTPPSPIAVVPAPEPTPVAPPASEAPPPSSVPPDLTSSTLTVAWHAPVTQNLLSIYSKLDSVSGYLYGIQVDLADLTTSKLWDTGVVQGGAYGGYKVLLLERLSPGELGGPYFIYDRLLLSPDGKKMLELTALSLSDAETGGLLPPPFFIPAPNLRIPALEQIKTLTLANSKTIVATYLTSFTSYSWEDLRKQLVKIAKTSDGQDVYAGSGGCVYVIGPDGEPFSYASLIPTTANPNNTQIYNDVQVTWDSGSTSTNYLPYVTGGCGGHGCADIVTDIQIGAATSIVAAGRTSEGDAAYIAKDPVQHPEFQAAYDSWYVAENKPSIEEFARESPNAVFFWKDAFGRWVRYQRADLQPTGECGKPVIYLYPQKTEKVSVRLPSFVQVTESVPAYPTQGWRVTASPDGTLTQNGSAYGSLYWEGVGVNYPKPTDGFVVKDGDVDGFLKITLKKYGLTDHEAQEFRDFWVPKMTGAPYYRVSFLTGAWSSAAPLAVNPKPETQIRIFMDWQKLQAPISLIAPKIVTPTRQGFTLVEWGGTLYK